jgi:hypothetical protein
MRKIILNILFLIFLTLNGFTCFSQTTTSKIEDESLKVTLYAKYKNQVRAYSIKDFDALFFEFFKESKDASKILSKEEFYTYTIKIAIYSEKQGLLYKSKKDEATSTKEEWFSKNYTDYLATKNFKN